MVRRQSCSCIVYEAMQLATLFFEIISKHLHSPDQAAQDSIRMLLRAGSRHVMLTCVDAPQIRNVAFDEFDIASVCVASDGRNCSASQPSN